MRDLDSILDTKSTCPNIANDTSMESVSDAETSVAANSRSTGTEIVEVLDADSKLLTRARTRVAVAVEVLDWLVMADASAIKLMSSSTLIEVLDCEDNIVLNWRCTGKTRDGVLEVLLMALDSERAMFSTEVAVNEPDVTADNSAISVVVLSVIEDVELLLVNAEAKAR